jgi:uncharacterized damage-inducible protein DinB
MTYGRGVPLDDRQKAALAAERNLATSQPDVEQLLKEWDATVERALKQLGETNLADLGNARSVGRAQLPSTVRGLLFHAAEHASRHVGQIVTTAKIVGGS